MAKVTSKYQVSIPRQLAERLNIEPGDDIQWSVSGDELRITPTTGGKSLSPKTRLEMFDAATARQDARNRLRRRKPGVNATRGWTRDELYDRGRSR
jgi:AbrB family looped-hinge helix DNA binding protein